MLEVKTSKESGQTVIDLVGEMDIATVDQFKMAVEEVRDGVSGMVFNLAELSFVDSTGVGGLLNVIKSLKYDDMDVKVINVTDEVYEVFDLLGLPMLLGNDIFLRAE